jgi:hypothetical protein
MTTSDQIIATAQAVKDARRVLEPALKPLEAEIRGELSMIEMAKLSTMLLTYNMDKTLSTESAARNYIALQNTILGAAQRLTKLPDLAGQLPAAAKSPEVATVLRELKAEALLKVLGTDKPASGFTPAAPVSFED